MENDQEKLKQHLIQLRKELVQVKQSLHEKQMELRLVKRECIKGFRAISETGNTRVADVFLDELEEED